MNNNEYSPNGEMRVVMHNIYEYQKGVRDLVLCTVCKTCGQMIMQRLDNQGIEYVYQSLGQRKINLFFGKRECLDVVNGFIHKPLNQLTAEEDFILGTMLGYNLQIQCRRYCERKLKINRKVS